MAKNYWFAKHPEGKLLQGSADVSNPLSLNNDDVIDVSITVAGATLGDFVLGSISIDPEDLSVSASVTAADTVTLTLSNSTGSGVDLDAFTANALVIPNKTYYEA
jgi:hypothetical protein